MSLVAHARELQRIAEGGAGAGHHGVKPVFRLSGGEVRFSAPASTDASSAAAS
jgi:hypothetical protein